MDLYWKEDLIFEGVKYIVDQNGVLYEPGTMIGVGQWEANFGYGGEAGCGGIVTWFDYRDEEKHNAKVKVLVMSGDERRLTALQMAITEASARLAALEKKKK